MAANKTNLSQLMKDILDDYTDEVVKAVDEALQEVGEEAADELKSSASAIGGFEDRTGKYRKSWTVTHEAKRTYTATIVHAKSPHYRLTHLLEYGHIVRNGHAKRNGGREKTRAFPHIYTVNENAQDKAVKKVMEAIEKIK